MLLAELTNFYSKEKYYMAVRSCIRMHRYRPAVLDYLKLDADDRQARLISQLSKPLKRDSSRNARIIAVNYFCRVYPHRLPNFKRYLTREEYLSIV